MTDYRSTAEWRAFVAAIRERPEDDLPRLVAADWLDERGEGERAELIRVQCSESWGVPCEQMRRPLVDLGHPDIEVGCTTLAHPAEPPQPEWCPQCQNRQRAANIVTGYEVSRESVRTPLYHQIEPPGDGRTGCLVHWWVRGFVELVKGPLSVLVGGECGRCSSWMEGDDCPDCHGTGRTSGILRDLLRVEPATEVEVTGAAPVEDNRGGWYWRQCRGLSRFPEDIPIDLFTKNYGLGELFPARESALAALNRAVYEHCLEPVGVSR